MFGPLIYNTNKLEMVQRRSVLWITHNCTPYDIVNPMRNFSDRPLNKDALHLLKTSTCMYSVLQNSQWLYRHPHTTIIITGS